ncbi:unnamed protein product [Clonostachys chloroleuca]|uniref:Myb-like domain-containing protein n=1 Tax=Clonostachys chloroleuca TaxID=1926264 RepID=A0AA35M875_9HYPO|nr:unnamed protein product [Clonostachys chloroleuca]
MVTWTPPAAGGSERTSQAKHINAISHPGSSFQPPSTSAPRDQLAHEPICISSDDESASDADGEASCDGSPDMDDSSPDDTLPSIDAIIASIKKSSPDISPTRSLIAKQPQALDTDAGLSSLEAATGPDMLLSYPPTAPQAGSAEQSHASNSRGCVDLVTMGKAVTTGHPLKIREVSCPPPSPLSEPDAQCDCSESCGASDAKATAPQHAMEQTQDDSQSIGHALRSCPKECSDSQSTSQASSNSDGLRRQREEDSLISSASLSLYIREEEEERSDKDKAINGNISQPLVQLRHKGTRKDCSTPEQGPASNCDSDSDVSSISGSEAAVRGDEDYCPSPSRGEGEQANNDLVDDEADSSGQAPPCKRRKVGGSQSRPRPRHRGRRLTNRTRTANRSGLHTPVHSASSVSSHDSFVVADAEMPAARFEEWPLQGATLKRLFVDGKVTFQLEFGWEPCASGHAPGSQSANGFHTHIAKRPHRTPRSPASHTFTREEEDLIVKLKEEQQLPWPEIHKQFCDEFPQRRSQGSLQVRYCTRLKKRSVKGATRKSR